MSGNHTKGELLGALLEAVQMTRAGEDVMGMEMTPDGEWVYILYKGGSKRVPVAADSGIAFMRDILNHM